MTKTETATGAPRVWIEDGGILRIDYTGFDRITLAAISSAFEQHMQLSPQPYPVLVTGYTVFSADYEAQRFATSPEVCRYTLALAIVLPSFLARHVAQMFIAYHRPPHPTRLFPTEDAAREWLVGYRPT